MPLARKRLSLLTSIAVLALAADKDKPKMDILPAASYPHHMTSQGVTIAAVPYTTEEQTKTAFGKLNPNDLGILPVFLVVENTGNATIRVDRMKLEFVAQGDVRVENTPARDVKYLQGANRPTMIPGPTGGVHVKAKKSPLAEWEIEGRAFTADMVPPHDKAGGFFYFQTAPRRAAKVVINGLVDAKSGQELFFFEIPLE